MIFCQDSPSDRTSLCRNIMWPGKPSDSDIDSQSVEIRKACYYAAIARFRLTCGNWHSFKVMWGLCKILCLGTPQSPANRDPIAIPQLLLFRFSVSYLKRWPSSIHTWKLEGSVIARMGRASLVKLAQPPSNRRPTSVQFAEFVGDTSVCSFQPLPVSRFRKHSLGLHRRNQHSAFQACSQKRRDVRRHHNLKHHAASKFTIVSLPFRGPIAGLSQLEVSQSRGSTSCRCSYILDMQLRTAPMWKLAFIQRLRP